MDARYNGRGDSHYIVQSLKDGRHFSVYPECILGQPYRGTPTVPPAPYMASAPALLPAPPAFNPMATPPSPPCSPVPETESTPQHPTHTHFIRSPEGAEMTVDGKYTDRQKEHNKLMENWKGFALPAQGDGARQRAIKEAAIQLHGIQWCDTNGHSIIQQSVTTPDVAHQSRYLKDALFIQHHALDPMVDKGGQCMEMLQRVIEDGGSGIEMFAALQASVFGHDTLQLFKFHKEDTTLAQRNNETVSGYLTRARRHIPGVLNLADIFTKEMRDVSHFKVLRGALMSARIVDRGGCHRWDGQRPDPLAQITIALECGIGS